MFFLLVSPPFSLSFFLLYVYLFFRSPPPLPPPPLSSSSFLVYGISLQPCYKSAFCAVASCSFFPLPSFSFFLSLSFSLLVWILNTDVDYRRYVVLHRISSFQFSSVQFKMLSASRYRLLELRHLRSCDSTLSCPTAHRPKHIVAGVE